ncbi:MAG: hypothetical protein ACOYMW_07850 [Candidatus Competibacteraceae bacterium]
MPDPQFAPLPNHRRFLTALLAGSTALAFGDPGSPRLACAAAVDH